MLVLPPNILGCHYSSHSPVGLGHGTCSGRWNVSGSAKVHFWLEVVRTGVQFTQDLLPSPTETSAMTVLEPGPGGSHVGHSPQPSHDDHMP